MIRINRFLVYLFSALSGASILPHARTGGFILFDKPDDKSGGGAPKGTLEEQLTAARNELELHRKSVSTLTTERDAARNEASTLKGQFDSATKTATEGQAKITELTGQVTGLTTQLSEASGKLTKSTENVARLEKLCSVKGIDTTGAVPEVPESKEGEHVFDQWMKSSGSAKTTLWRAHEKEIRAEGLRRQAALR